MTTVKMPNMRPVYTNNPEQEVWNFIASFENEHFVRQFALGRISNKFYGFDFNSLNEKKLGFNEHQKEDRYKVEILEPLKTQDVENIAAEITRNATQARDFYIASAQLPLLSKPILLHYAFEKLVNVLTLLTFRINKDTYSHGLTYYKGEPIKVKSKGLFQRFHDCFSEDPSIYLERRAFKLENLVNAGQLYEYYLFDLMRNNSIESNSITDEDTGRTVRIHELDREFILVYALSTMARYRVSEWSEIIEGKTSELVLRIQRYLQSIQSFFPNLVLNVLYGEIILFYQPGRVGC